jgi:hypothetical protein
LPRAQHKKSISAAIPNAEKYFTYSFRELLLEEKIERFVQKSKRFCRNNEHYREKSNKIAAPKARFLSDHKSLTDS